jgi:MFS family permease
MVDRDRLDYRSMLGINFLWNSATIGVGAVFSLILRQRGIDVRLIGIVMSMGVVASIIGAQIAGTASVRCGPLRVVIAAILCTGTALVSFEWTTAYPIPLLLSRLLQGLGFGLFMTAGISYVQSKTPEPNQQYAMGMFSAMAIAPFFFAQWESQYWLDHYGPDGIFLAHSLVFLFVLAFALALLRTEKPVRGHSKDGSYRAVLALPQVYPPYLCIFINGMLYGFGGSFLPILLKDSGILLGFYFTPFALVTLGSRFFFMKHLQKLPKPLVLSLGMISLGLSAMLPVFALNTETILVSGALFGVGHSFVGPTVAVSVGQYFAPAERPRTNALMYNCLQVGWFVSPLAASYAMAGRGLRGLLFFMGLIGIAAIVMPACVFIPGARTRPVSSSEFAHEHEELRLSDTPIERG